MHHSQVFTLVWDMSPGFLQHVLQPAAVSGNLELYPASLAVLYAWLISLCLVHAPWASIKLAACDEETAACTTPQPPRA